MNRIILLMIWIFTANASRATVPDFTVAADGSGDFITVQEAINAVPDLRRNTTVIFIKNGTYKEKLVLPDTKTNVHFIGENKDSVLLTFDDFASRKNRFGEEIGTSGSASFFVHGDGFTAENISFENSAGPVGQAVAVRVAADRVRFINCRFLGFQDTLYTWGYGGGSRQYYKNCYIEGTVDFIFGSSTAVFDSCHIFGKKAGYFTAASTPDSAANGYVFRHCRLDGNGPAASFYLGRPWRPFAKTVFISCEMSAIVKPEGWHNWGKPEAEKSSFYAEYKSRGAGAAPARRVGWSHQLSTAAAYQLTRIFHGWDPA
ncbi:hypothetical protein GCM10027051_19960 [Niabella terrae]